MLLLDRTLNMLFLLGSQAAAAAYWPTALAYVKPTNASIFIALDAHADGSVTQANCLRDPMPIHSTLLGTDHLPPALMLRCRTQLMCALLLHVDWMRLCTQTRGSYGPNL